jgi:hypothetical protein
MYKPAVKCGLFIEANLFIGINGSRAADTVADENFSITQILTLVLKKTARVPEPLY